MVVIALSPEFTYCGAKVSWHHCLQGYERVALITPVVESRYLVEDHNGVLHMPVNGMHLGVSINSLPPWTYLNRAVNGRGIPQEGHPVFHRPMEYKYPQYRPGPY